MHWVRSHIGKVTDTIGHQGKECCQSVDSGCKGLRTRTCGGTLDALKEKGRVDRVIGVFTILAQHAKRESTLDITIVACILHALGRFRMYSRELCTTSMRLQVPRSCNRGVSLVKASQKQAGNALVTLGSGCLADASGDCLGNALQTANGVQAYLQADKKGDDSWVELPDEAQPGHVCGSTQLEAFGFGVSYRNVGSEPFPCDSSEVRSVCHVLGD